MGYYCGIDLGNKETLICIIQKNRQVVKEEQILTNGESLQASLGKYRKLTCIVEASPLAEWLCMEVEKLGHKVSMVCPRKAKVALASQSKKKTDRRDARALAELCRSGWYEAVHRKSEEAREMRSYLTARKQLVESSTAISSSIRGILRAHGVKLQACTDDPNFEGRVRKASKKLPELARRGIEELLKAFELLHVQQRTLYKELHKHARENEITKLLQTIPGVGPATAAAFVATIDDPNRFPDGEKVAAYLGLTPSVYQSGETEYRGRITKTGDKLLRWLLVEAAHILLSRSGTPCELKARGLKLQEAKGVGKARVAVARLYAGIMWKMWKDKSEFYPEPLPAAA
ncbi:MAG: IS110 family transposase [Bdellovibrionales bacterium]|nr:IS110 family transposase [Bdellovibrionales bacterium]